MARTGGGSIVNISSLASVKPTPITTVYAAAKAGLNALTTATAIEYAQVGVRVNGIICGTFDTDAAWVSCGTLHFCLTSCDPSHWIA